MNKNRKHIGIVPILLAGLSLVPVLGALIGPVAIAWGVSTRRPCGTPVAIAGVVGILLTFGLYAVLGTGVLDRAGAGWSGTAEHLSEPAVAAFSVRGTFHNRH